MPPTEMAEESFARKAEELRQPALVLQSGRRLGNSPAAFFSFGKGSGKENEAKRRRRKVELGKN